MGYDLPPAASPRTRKP